VSAPVIGPAAVTRPANAATWMFASGAAVTSGAHSAFMTATALLIGTLVVVLAAVGRQRPAEVEAA
jgi:hypothetical protein